MYSYKSLLKSRKVDGIRFVVPTGNFGDILAGYYFKQMMPAGSVDIDLVCATNSNDILDRFIKTGKYEKHDVLQTQSPAMDICVSSNFERFMWYAAQHAGDASKVVCEWWEELNTTGRFSVNSDVLKVVKRNFISGMASDPEVIGSFS